MELDNNSEIVVHGGGVYGDKEKTIKRWCDQYYRLPENVQRRLVIENCEKCFSIKDCLKIANQVAGLSTLKLGAGNSMPNLSDLS